MADKRKKVLIIGGGFGGLFTALDLANDCEVTLVSDADHFTFRPLLYEYLSGEVEAWHIAPDYKELFGDEINFVRGAVEAVDFENQTVKVSTRDEILYYDALCLAVGGVTNFWNVAGRRRKRPAVSRHRRRGRTSQSDDAGVRCCFADARAAGCAR
jgi:NADH dehydrogenase